MQGALWIIYEAYSNKTKANPSWIWVFWLSFTFGFVLKGVTPLFGLLTLLALCCVEKNGQLLREIRLFWGLVLFLILTLLWLAMVNQAEHSNYLLQIFKKDLLPKLSGSHESHGKPPLFHLSILPLTFWPGSLFLWPAVAFAWQKRHTTMVTFLLAWILPSWIFFECMPTKLPQYILPIFPALAILCAKSIELQRGLTAPKLGVRILQFLWLLLSLGLSLFLMLSSWFLLDNISYTAITLFLIIGFFSSIALYYAKKGGFQQAIIALFFMAATLFPLLFQKFIPDLKPLWLSPAVLAQVDKDKITKDAPLLVVGFEEPGLVFNFNTKLISFSDPITAIGLLNQMPNRLALFEGSYLKSLDKQIQESLKIDASVRGFNYSKGKWVTLVIVHT
jgi:4-amino-4-deoxy-L-arabinose transferase-like glycosyltransferase